MHISRKRAADIGNKKRETGLYPDTRGPAGLSVLSDFCY